MSLEIESCGLFEDLIAVARVTLATNSHAREAFAMRPTDDEGVNVVTSPREDLRAPRQNAGAIMNPNADRVLTCHAYVLPSGLASFSFGASISISLSAAPAGIIG